MINILTDFIIFCLEPWLETPEICNIAELVVLDKLQT